MPTLKMTQVRLYRYSRSLVQRLLVLIEVVFEGFWLGVLSHSSLLRIDEAYYNESDLYFSTDYNKKGLSKWEMDMVAKYFRDCHRLMLIGAGGGRETCALQKMGYVVDAFECNPKLREFGNSFLAAEGLSPCIQDLERDAGPQNDGKYDGVIVGWGAYMLIQGSRRRASFLRTVRPQLADDSNILLSFFTRGAYSKRFRYTVSIANTIRSLLGRSRVEIGDSLAPNYVHYFTETELSRELEDAGFEMRYFSTRGYGHAVVHSKQCCG